MKVIYSSYGEDLVYDEFYNTEIEERIFNYINEYTKDGYSKILDNDNNVVIQRVFSKRINNSLSWYPFKANSKCLQVLGNFGEMTEFLKTKFEKLTCIETIKNRAEINRKRNSEDNVQIICTSQVLQLNLKEKYDYIILYDVLENAKSIIKNSNISPENAASVILANFKRYLTEDGKIIIATKNKFGIKYFAGKREYEGSYSCENILNTNDSNINNTFSKSELVNILEMADMDKFKFYYPLPDYYNTSVIYSDKYLPAESSSKLNYNIYYDNFDTIIFNEINAMKNISKSGYFDIFSNAYLIEVANHSCDINYISFNNLRKEKYRLITKIKNNIVEKSSSIESKEHIEQIKRNIDKIKSLNIDTLDSYDENNVFSKYTNSQSLDQKLYFVAISEGKEKLIADIQKWYEYIKLKLNLVGKIDSTDNIFKKYDIDISEEKLHSLNFTKNGFWDLVFENIFVENEKYLVYDQEWFEKNIPIEFILYRSIRSLYFHNPKIKGVVNESEIFKYFNIYEYIEVFEKLEEILQAEISDPKTISFFEKTYEVITSLEGLEQYRKDAILLKNILADKNEQINKLSEELDTIKSSKIWKIFKGIIKNRRLFKRK